LFFVAVKQLFRRDKPTPSAESAPVPAE